MAFLRWSVRVPLAPYALLALSPTHGISLVVQEVEPAAADVAIAIAIAIAIQANRYSVVVNQGETPAVITAAPGTAIRRWLHGSATVPVLDAAIAELR